MAINQPSSQEELTAESVLMEITAKLHVGDSQKIAFVRSFYDQIQQDGKLLQWVIGLCGDDMRKFVLFASLPVNDKNAVTALCQTAQAVGFENANFEACCAVLTKYGYEGYTKLRSAQSACHGDWNRLGIFSKAIVEWGYSTFEFLVSLAGMYGSDSHKFHRIANSLFELYSKRGTPGLDALKKLKGAYGNNPSRFEAFAEVIIEADTDCAELLARLKFVYLEDNDQFQKIKKRLLHFNYYAPIAQEALFHLRYYYGSNVARFDDTLECIEKFEASGEMDALDSLSKCKGVIGTDPAKFQFVVHLIDEKKYAVCQTLGSCPNSSIWGLKDLEIFAEHAASLEYMPHLISAFMAIYKQKGKAAAEAYREGLKKKAKGLVSSGIPRGHRASREYMFYVKYVFPQGDYSNYEHNLACGDKLEHLAPYKFKKEGYPAVLSGVVGHKVKDQQVENMELVQSYDKRMENVRGFIAGRNPGNAELAKNFEARVEGLFDEYAEEPFKKAANLTVKEKMVALFLSEAARKEKAKQKNKDYRPAAQIMDLALVYHYSHRQSIEHHAQRVEQEIKSHGNPVSRNYYIWRELSVIYGENVKHVLQQDILADGRAEDMNMEKLEAVFAEILQDDEKSELSKKQVRNVEGLFANEHIPAEKKPDALQKQALTVFGANIKFSSTQESDQFKEEVAHIVKGCTGENFNAAYFLENRVPLLFKLRKKFRLGTSQKLEDLFLLDMHRINGEIDKYEEITEVEMKEKQMAGPRDQKVVKKALPRKIRGFFTKTRESANARMGAYICIADDQVMWDDDDYFEFVMMDEETGKCRGLVMLKTIHTGEGKYLFFGPNPFESLLDQVSSRQCYEYLFRTIAEFADQNNFEGVFIPEEENRILGSCTNRGGDFPGFIKQSRIRDRRGALRTVNFAHHFTLGYYQNSAFTYKSGALIWSRDNAPKRSSWAN